MATPTATRYQKTYPGRADQVHQVRHDLSGYLRDCPVAHDAILIVSEIATNAVVHSESAGEFFTVRAELHGDDYLWLECEDLGGTWHCKTDEDYPHGIGIVNALAGEDNWGVDGDHSGRVVWCRLSLPASGGGQR
jgi:anti-sigma regulatory factor (Ser/Thr protein kinase)